MNDNKIVVSVIIPTYNRCNILLKCVLSVLESTYTQVEIIIIDNASTDDTRLCIENCIQERGSDKIKYYYSDINLMAAGGRNKGIELAAGQYLVFLDNDNIVYPDMIEKLVMHAKLCEDAGLIGALSLNAYANDSIWTLSGRYNFFTTMPANLYSGKKIKDIKENQEVFNTCYCPNAFLVKREVIDLIGGFDAAYHAIYEEADFGYRVLMAGFRAIICKDAITRHYGYVEQGANEKLRHLGINNKERAYHFAKNRTIFMRKYAPKWCMPSYYLIMIHLFAIFYCGTAMRLKRPDIAAAYIKGEWKGLVRKVEKNMYVPYSLSCKSRVFEPKGEI